MRIEALTVTAFGPFLDRRFEFAPGFTILYGGNEAGKSSLHAALYAALCGVRRGRGRSTAEHEFDRYRPWHRTGTWRVAVRLELADGRRVEIDQDLDDKPRSRAFDVDLGRDLTDEILPRDGTPDATLWLGLDRRAFAATACMRQAELLAVRGSSEALREVLQRAAATSGADATAAEAIARIAGFLKEHVGGKQVNSVKPLRRSMDRAEAARVALEEARAEHRAYVELLEREEVLEAARLRADRDEALVRAARARTRARALRRDCERARELAMRHPDGAPAGLVADDDRMREVDRALLRYDSRARTVELVGRPTTILRQELEALDHELGVLGAGPVSTTRASAVGSPVPVVLSPERVDRTIAGRSERIEGRMESTEARTRTEPRDVLAGGNPDVVAPGSKSSYTEDSVRAEAELREAVEEVRVARRLIEEHAGRRPPELEAPAAGGASADELRALSDVLSRPEPRIDPALEARCEELAHQLERGERRRHLRGRAALGVTALALLVLAAAWLAPRSRETSRIVWSTAAVGLLAVAAGLALARSPGRLEDDVAALRRVESQLLEERLRRDDWRADRDQAELAAGTRGLDPQADTLRRLAHDLQQWEQARDRLATWEQTHGSLHADRLRHETTLRRTLEARGVVPGDDVLADAERCAQIGSLQVRRRDLETQLARRQRDEDDANRVRDERQAAEDELVTMARRGGLEADDAAAARLALIAWRESRRQSLRVHEQAVREWAELERLRAGRTLGDLEHEVEALETQARKRAAPFDPGEIEAVDCSDAALETCERARREAESALDRLRVEIHLRARAVPKIAEAEEALRDAELELERVQRLETTLLATRELLNRAQDRVHRSVAPVLATAVRESLSPVTAGRYDDVLVDPETLDVRVHERDGDWREAGLLSHGTAEQIYLLLRIAMAQHLVKRGETSPLLLDDVTVQFDRDRKRATLEMLWRKSAERQILLWSQEDDVLEWARERLVLPRDALLILEPQVGRVVD